MAGLQELVALPGADVSAVETQSGGEDAMMSYDHVGRESESSEDDIPVASVNKTQKSIPKKQKLPVYNWQKKILL